MDFPFEKLLLYLRYPSEVTMELGRISFSKEQVQSGSLDRSFTLSICLFVILMLTIPG